MSTESRIHVSWEQIRWVITALVIPILGLIITIVIWGTKTSSAVDGLTTRMDKVENAVHDIRGQVDTIQNRQLQYHYENKLYQAQQGKK